VGGLVKDVAGYDLRRLLCGSEGTLAVMTELTLRLVPAPEASGIGMAYFLDLADAARAVSRVLASGVLPVTLEFSTRSASVRSRTSRTSGSIRQRARCSSSGRTGTPL
jgi:glycolate oxidase